jgi:pyruvate dehydrogenase E1 component alpha subunit
LSIQVYEGATLECLRENPIEILRKMLLIRIFEEKVEELFLVKGMLIGPAHLYLGQEAIAVGICSNLKKEDIVITTYRGHGHAIAKGVSIKKIMAELFGKKNRNMQRTWGLYACCYRCGKWYFICYSYCRKWYSNSSWNSFS